MTVLWSFIAILWAIVWVITIVDIVRRQQRRRAIAVWLALVIILPVIGAILYWVLRKPTAQEIENARITGGEVRPPIGRDLRP